MDDDEDEEYSNEFIPLIPRRSHSHRLAIRRTLLRSSPYSTNRRREHSSLVSRTINNLISNIEDQNIENNHVPTNDTTSNDHLRPIEEHFLLSSDEDHNHEDLESIVDLSQADLPINHGEFSHGFSRSFQWIFSFSISNR